MVKFPKWKFKTSFVMKNKLVRFLIILNGTLLPLVLIFLLFQIGKEILKKKDYPYQEEGIIVGEELEQAKKDTLALQGLQYDTPIKIYNSKNYYMPLSLMTYEEKKKVIEIASYANDIGTGLLKRVNVIFLDEKYQVINTLLDKKASVLEIKFQREDYETYRYSSKIDETVKYVGYLICFEDTNKDQKINSLDNHDLYISDLEGRNLKKVTNNLSIDSFEFIKSNSQILIRYNKRLNVPDEHKEIEFAIYDIEKGVFLDLSSLNKELKRLENIIIN